MQDLFPQDSATHRQMLFVSQLVMKRNSGRKFPSGHVLFFLSRLLFSGLTLALALALSLGDLCGKRSLRSAMDWPGWVGGYNSLVGAQLILDRTGLIDTKAMVSLEAKIAMLVNLDRQLGYFLLVCCGGRRGEGRRVHFVSDDPRSTLSKLRD